MAIRTSSSRRASLASSALASLALATGAVAPVFGAACGSTSDTSPSGDAGADGAISEGDAGSEDASYPIDAAIGARCTMQNLSDPVGLCVQKAALLGEHAEFSAVTGLPSTWSVDTLLATTTDAGATVHDVRDDIGYGASLADYYASATAYGDPDQLATITGDMDAVAQLLETELATLPADYDGAIYTRLRRLAAGLRLASFSADGDAIDAIAAKYGRAIYTNYFHALSGVVVTPDAGTDAGTDDGGVEDGGPSDDAAATEDASIVDASSGDATTGDASVADAGPGLTGDGILGTAASSGYAYDAAKAASGALALVDMAARANGYLATTDGGADAAAPDPADALTWTQAAAAVLNHLASRAHDGSGLYFNVLQTSSAPGHDTFTDDGSFATQTQGSIALSYVRAARLATLAHLSVSALPSQALTNDAAAILGALQSTTPPLWDPLFNNLALAACSAAIPPVVPCGSGFFAGLDSTKTVVDQRKGIGGNAFLLAALHRASLLTTLTPAEGDDVTPLLGLFSYRNQDQYGEDSGFTDGFFTQVVGQAAFVSYVTRTFAFTETEDGGLPELEDGAVFGGAQAGPLARAYSAAATADAIEGLNDQWIGLTGAPALFQ